VGSRRSSLEGLVNKLIDTDFWRGKRVFITGHSGFKGSWLSIWLDKLGATVKGYSLDPPTNPNLFKVARVDSLVQSDFDDVRDLQKLQRSVVEFSPDIVIHLAAQPLVRDSYRDPLKTFSVNIMGTANLLEAVRNAGTVRVVVNITTDKVYANKDWHWGYREIDQLGGLDPYSSSKSCAELITSCYGRSFFEDNIGLGTARAGNVIGGGDWASERLIPDLIRSSLSGNRVNIRNPRATRPWQHVLVPLSGYLLLAQQLFSDAQTYSGEWNFGPLESDARSVSWVVEYLGRTLPETSWVFSEVVDEFKETDRLQLDISKARAALGWMPFWRIEDAIEQTVRWYKAWSCNVDMLNFTRNQIEEYMEHIDEFGH